MESANFPDALNISPSSNKWIDREQMDAVSNRQRDAIQKFGIAVPNFLNFLTFHQEAAYLLVRYLDSHGSASKRKAVEYDPPWLPSKLSESDTCKTARAVLHDLAEPSSEIIIELGSGMGVVGFAVAASLHEHMKEKEKNEPGGTQTENAGIRDVQVVLTDLPEVHTLLEENVAIQVKEWAATGKEGILFEQEAVISNLKEPKTPQTDHAQRMVQVQEEKSPLVTLKVRDLAWGNENHVQALSSELRDIYVDAPNRSEHVRLTILCSDLVYFPHLLAPLLRSLIQITSPGFFAAPIATTSTIVISYRIRSYEKESPFWRAFGAWFHFEPVLIRPSQRCGREDEDGHDGDGHGDDDNEWNRVGWDESALSFIFIARRKPESLSWECPMDDRQLLYGQSGDDTFETLLMLCNDTA